MNRTLALVSSEDSVLVPCKKALCLTCREVTLHAHVGHWYCNICGRDLENAPEPNPIPLSAELFIVAMGYPLSWRLVAVLREKGQSRTYPISKAANSSHLVTSKALQRLYEAGIVLRFDPSKGKNSCPLWSLNRANPITQKILAVLEDVEENGWNGTEGAR